MTTPRQTADIVKDLQNLNDEVRNFAVRHALDRDVYIKLMAAARVMREAADRLEAVNKAEPRSNEATDAKDAMLFLQKKADTCGKKALACQGSSWAPVFAQKAKWYTIAVDALRVRFKG